MSLKTDFNRSLNSLLKRIEERRYNLIRELLWTSYWRYGLYENNLLRFNWGGEVANDDSLNDLYKKADLLLTSAKESGIIKSES